MSLSIPRRPPILNINKKRKRIRKMKKNISKFRLLGNHLKDKNGILKERNAQLHLYIEKFSKLNKELLRHAKMWYKKTQIMIIHHQSLIRKIREAKRSKQLKVSVSIGK
jgi:hypothetical protein